MRRSRPAWLAKGKTRERTARPLAGLWAQAPAWLQPSIWVGALGRVSSRAAALGRTRFSLQKRAMVLSPLAAGLFVSVVATPLLISEGSRAAFAAAVKDPLSLLAQRSPGERAPGAKHSTKPPRIAQAGPVVPRERVLPSVRERAPDISPAAAAAPEAGLPVVDAPVEVAEAGPAPAVPFIAPPFFGPNTIVPGPGPDSGGNPGPGPGPGPDPDPGTDPEPPVPAVPEPATWAMLLAGFFATGAAMRWRARKPALVPARISRAPTR